MPVPPLETERLALTPLDTADAADLHEAMRDPVAMRYWHQPPHESLAATVDTVNTLIRPGAANWAVRLRDSGRCIGYVGFLSNTSPHGFGYFLNRDFWRRGIMSEAAEAVLACAFDTLGYPQAEAWIREDNEASLALARKLGFKEVGELAIRAPHQQAATRSRVFGLWAHEFLHAPANGPAVPQARGIIPQLPVADVARSIRFYVDQLGFRLAFAIGDPPAFAALTPSRWSGSKVEIRIQRAAAPCQPRPDLVVPVHNLDELHARYRAAGIDTLTPIETMPWDEREFSVHDPDGHALRFTGL